MAQEDFSENLMRMIAAELHFLAGMTALTLRSRCPGEAA
jgi:hypothetical protein